MNESPLRILFLRTGNAARSQMAEAYIITMCDRCAEACPVFPGDEEQQRAFEHVASGLSNRIRLWMALPKVRPRMDLVRAG